MKTISKYLIAVAAVLCISFSVAYAQDNNREDRQEWENKFQSRKIAFLSNFIGLTPEEAQAFWPVYNQADAAHRESFKKNMQAYKALQEAVDNGKSEKEISSLLDKYLKVQAEGVELDQKYVSKYKKVISAEKVAKLYLGEEAFRRSQIHDNFNRREKQSKQ